MANFLTYLVLMTISAAAAAAAPTVYQVLQSYDFPVGLLPKGVTGYQINPVTGRFAVYLSKTCTFTIQAYELKYGTKITGTIVKDRITNLRGIQVKILFLWPNIIEVTKTGDGTKLQFSVGIASAGFPVSSFYESPQCGCGFHCPEKGLANDFSVIPLLEE